MYDRITEIRYDSDIMNNCCGGCLNQGAGSRGKRGETVEEEEAQTEITTEEQRIKRLDRIASEKAAPIILGVTIAALFAGAVAVQLSK